MTTVEQLLKQIGIDLRSVRISRGKSVKGHCRDTKQTESNYINIEAGRRTISLNMLINLASQQLLCLNCHCIKDHWNGKDYSRDIS